jgi:hypothetical protein
MTPADIQLISNLAGALNTGRALVPHAERFGNLGIPATEAPSVKWSHADELEELVKRAQGSGGGEGPTPPAANLFRFDMAWQGYPSRWKFPANPVDPDPPNFMNVNFTGDMVIVAKLIIPADVGVSLDQGYTSCFEHGGPPQFREVTLSLTENDFRDVDPSGERGPLAIGGGMQGSIFWGTGEPNGATLKPGGTYYFNFRNKDGEPGQSYPAMIETNWPHYPK